MRNTITYVYVFCLVIFGLNLIQAQNPNLTGVVSVAPIVTTDPFFVTMSFSEPVLGFEMSDMVINGGVAISMTQSSMSTYVIAVAPQTTYGINATLPSLAVTDLSGNFMQGPSNIVFALYQPGVVPPCLAEYHLEEQNDGYYQVSLLPKVTYTGTDAITATAQVTLVVNHGTFIGNTFTVTDLTMLTPGVTWSQNARYDTPSESRLKDFISFGMTTYGTNLIPYVAGDTVPLFRFKNKGICLDANEWTDSVRLMSIVGEAFAWPNSENANVGQQLSVSGYNQPDVPMCISGVASCMAEVDFDLKALLQGAYVSTDGLMHDQLRSQDLLPNQEPYSDYQPIRGGSYHPFTHVDEGGGEAVTDPSVFADKSNAPDDIVDWVFVSLHHHYLTDSVINTFAGLVLRDGRIRGVDGQSLPRFSKVRSDKYGISVRHRNHLGLMSAGAVQLSNNITSFDFTNVIIPMLGEPNFSTNYRPGDQLVFSQHPGVTIDGKRMLWAGNSNADNYIMFQGGGIGQGLDIDNVFDNIFSDPLNATYSYNHVRDGYYPGDNNLDGKVKYQGPANDVDPFIFFNIISRHPDNVNKFINFYITEGIPRD
jgi:hypothetical protein